MMFFVLAQVPGRAHAPVMQSKSILGFALCTLVFGCDAAKNSGQTGSPFQDPPSYQSPGEFGPDGPNGPGGGTGNPGGPNLDNNPWYRRTASDLAKQQDDLLVVASQRGLLIFDTATPSDPQLIGELAFSSGSYPMQLLLQDDVATLVLYEWQDLVTNAIPTEQVPQQVQRIVRVDLSDPTTPVRMAQFDLGGAFWDLKQQGDRYFALTQVYAPYTAQPTCGDSTGTALIQLPLIGGGPESQYLRATEIDYVAGSLTEQAVVDLPSNGLGFVTAHGFASVTDGYLAEQQVNWVSFAAPTGLSELSTVDLTGQLTAVAAREGQMALVTQSQSGSVFQLYDSSGPTLELTSSVEVQVGATELQFIDGTDKLALSNGSAAASVIDVSMPSAAVEQALPGAAQRLVPTNGGLLGLSTDSNTADTTFSLWDVTGVPTALDTLETDWALFGLDDPSYQYWTLQGGTLAVSFHRQGDRYSTLGAIALTDGTLSVSGETHTLAGDPKPLLHDSETVAYGVNELHVEVIPLQTTAPAVADPATTLIELQQPHVIDTAQTADYDLELRVRPDTYREVVFTPRDGGDPVTLEMPHYADEMIVSGEQVVVAGLRWNTECQYMDPANGVAATIEPSPCGPQNDRGLTVLSTGSAPQIVKTMPIDAEMDWGTPIADTAINTTWDGYLQISETAFVFLVERNIQCNSQASCDELGVPAYTSMATPGGMACDNPADCEAQQPTGPFEITSGNKRETLYYVLDLSGNTPQLQAPVLGKGPVEIWGEGPLNLSARTFVSPGEFAFSGAEYLYNEQGNSLTDANGDPLQRFMLHRFSFNSDADIEALPAVNVPGRVVGYFDGRVFTAEPVRESATRRNAVLRESTIVNDGAFIEASVTLGGGYVTSLQIGERLFLLLGPDDYCASVLQTQLFELDLGAQGLDPSTALTLPGANWAFDWTQPSADQEQLLLRGGPAQYNGRLTLDVAQSGEPSVVSYESLNPRVAPQY